MLLIISINQIVAGILGNIATSVWYVPMGANILHKARGVKFNNPFSVYIGRGVILDNRYPSKISIGDGTVIAPRAVLLTHSFVPRGNTVVGIKEITKEVSIGPQTFIGAGCIILPGTKLGRGCYVAAGAVVSGEFGPDSLIAGNPAKTKRKCT